MLHEDDGAAVRGARACSLVNPVQLQNIAVLSHDLVPLKRVALVLHHFPDTHFRYLADLFLLEVGAKNDIRDHVLGLVEQMLDNLAPSDAISFDVLFQAKRSEGGKLNEEIVVVSHHLGAVSKISAPPLTK